MNVTLHDQDDYEAHEAYEDNRRQFIYHRKYGKSVAAALGRSKHQEKVLQTIAEPMSTLAEYQKALEAHAKTLEALKRTARDLPAGKDRWQAVRLGIAAGFRKAEVARLLGVSPQRVTQMLAEDDIPF